MGFAMNNRINIVLLVVAVVMSAIAALLVIDRGESNSVIAEQRGVIADSSKMLNRCDAKLELYEQLLGTVQAKKGIGGK